MGGCFGGWISFRAALSLHFGLEILDIGGNNTNFGGQNLRSKLLKVKEKAQISGTWATPSVTNGVQVVGASLRLIKFKFYSPKASLSPRLINQ